MSGFTTKKLRPRRSLGSILKAARSRAGLSLEEVEQRTKIPLKFLLALEASNYDRLPAEAYNIGYVRCLAECLNLNSEKIVRLYKEERSSKWHQNPYRSVSFSPRKIGEWHFLVTPKLLAVIGTILLFGVVASYIIVELRKFASPPGLVISNVPSEFTSDKDEVVLQGKTDPGAIVSINAEPIHVLSDGTFSQEVQLSPGVNEIVVQATNRAERVARHMVKVLYNQDLAKAAAPAKTE